MEERNEQETQEMRMQGNAAHPAHPADTVLRMMKAQQMDSDTRTKSERMFDKAVEADNLTPYPAQWRRENQQPHGVELVTVTKVAYDLLQQRSVDYDRIHFDNGKLSMWLNGHLKEEKMLGKWPWSVKMARGRDFSSVDMALLILDQWRYGGIKGWVRKTVKRLMGGSDPVDSTPPVKPLAPEASSQNPVGGDPWR